MSDHKSDSISLNQVNGVVIYNMSVNDTAATTTPDREDEGVTLNHQLNGVVNQNNMSVNGTAPTTTPELTSGNTTPESEGEGSLNQDNQSINDPTTQATSRADLRTVSANIDTKPPENPGQALGSRLPRPEKHNTTDRIPELTTQITENHDDLVAALRLIADSVAQQRQMAAKSILYHPAHIILMILIFGCIWYAMFRTASDWPVVFITWIGCLMVTMLGVKVMVSGYLEAAERTGTWRWLYGNAGDKTDQESAEQEKQQLNVQKTHSAPTSRQDIVLVTRFGEEVIATIVLRMEPKTTCDWDIPSSSHGKVLIRAWTVKHRYRGYGVGSALLREALLISLSRKCCGPFFADDHANSLHVLPERFNSFMNELDQLAHRKLRFIKWREYEDNKRKIEEKERVIQLKEREIQSNEREIERLQAEQELIREH